MSQMFEVLQDRYRDLVSQSLEGQMDGEGVEAVRGFLSDARQAGSAVADPGERAQLRAYMHFLATLLHEAGEEPGEIDLLPLDRERWPARPLAGRTGSTTPVWFWMLAGAAALVVVAGLMVVGGLSLGAVSLQPPVPTQRPPTSTVPPPSPTPAPTLTPMPTPTFTPRPPTPVFGELTVALGMLSPTEFFLTGNEFDWNTKAVYAVFDYADVRDGSSWSVVWTRDEEEVARENHIWDVEREGRSGTQWVVYFNPDGTVLQGGDYTVSLYVDGELEAEASFLIRYYVPPQ